MSTIRTSPSLRDIMHARNMYRRLPSNCVNYERGSTKHAQCIAQADRLSAEVAEDAESTENESMKYFLLCALCVLCVLSLRIPLSPSRRPRRGVWRMVRPARDR